MSDATRILNTSITEVDPAELVLHGANPRKGDLRAVTESFRANGFWGSVVVDERNGQVLAGNHRVMAARDLSMPLIPVTYVKPDSDEHALRILLADNRTSDLGTYDDAALAECLDHLASTDAGLEGLGYDGKDLAEIYRTLDAEQHDEKETAAIFSAEEITEDAFGYYRASGFPYFTTPIHECKEQINQLSQAEAATLPRTRLAYHVADVFHPHRFRSSTAKMLSPVEAFASDKLLRKALDWTQEQGTAIGTGYIGKLDIISGTQACANFRPGFACHIYRRFAPEGGSILDTSTGYGGRLVGFIASGIGGRYVGIDPSTETHKGNTKLAAALGFADRVELINKPAEDVDAALLEGRFDFAFTSPPYFSKERYADEPTQSFARYLTGEEWRDGFLRPMLALQFAALKPGCFAAVNIADVNIGGKRYPLADWTEEAATLAGFEVHEREAFSLAARVGTGQADEVAAEPVLIFRKPEQLNTRARETADA